MPASTLAASRLITAHAERRLARAASSMSRGQAFIERAARKTQIAHALSIEACDPMVEGEICCFSAAVYLLPEPTTLQPDQVDVSCPWNMLES